MKKPALLLALLPLLFLTAFLVLPLLRVLAEGGLSLGILGQPYFQGRLLWTLAQALLSALLALLIGGPLAYLLTRVRVPGTALLLRLLLLPFVTPTLVAALGLLSLFGPRGLLHLDLSQTPALLILGNLFFNLPLMIRLAYAGFSRVPPGAAGCRPHAGRVAAALGAHGGAAAGLAGAGGGRGAGVPVQRAQLRAAAAAGR